MKYATQSGELQCCGVVSELLLIPETNNSIYPPVIDDRIFVVFITEYFSKSP